MESPGRIATTTSADGTEIGWEVTGSGPPLVLVHGAMADRTKWSALRPHLEEHVTVHAIDRRGRGLSGDAPDYDIACEREDLVAVVAAVAAEHGGPVDVYAHSFGAMVAFGAAPAMADLRRLVLYEGWPPIDPGAFGAPPDLIPRLRELRATGQPEELLITTLREFGGMGDAALAAQRAGPTWAHQVALAGTIPRELGTTLRTVLDSRDAAAISVPTHLIVGGDSPVWGPMAPKVAAAIGDVAVTTIDGQAHAADLLAPEQIAAVVVGFIGR